MNSKAPDRLLALDSLRALAALAVLLYHYTSGYEHIVGPHSGWVPDFPFGYLGVELFFVISGFVIAWTLQRSASLAEFAFGRIARLYPAYLTCGAITGLVIFQFGFNPGHVHASDLAWNAVIGLAQLANATNLDASYWSLGLEVSFYVVAAIAAYGFPRIRFESFALAWLALSLASRFLFPGHAALHLLLVSHYSPLFVAGAMIFIITSPAMRADRLTHTTLAVAIGMCFIGSEPHWLRLTYGAGLCVFIGLVFVAVKGWLGPVLNTRPVVRLGQASYSLYLIHQIVGYWIISGLERQGVPPVMAITAATVVVIAVAMGLRRWIEIPAQRSLQTRLRTLITPARAPLAESGSR